MKHEKVLTGLTAEQVKALLNQLQECQQRTYDTDHCREVLKNRGFFTDNLWRVEDVMIDFDVEPEQAQQLLYNVLTSEQLIETIFNMIMDKGIELGYKQINQ